MTRHPIIMLLLQLALTIAAMLVVLHFQHISISVHCAAPPTIRTALISI